MLFESSTGKVPVEIRRRKGARHWRLSVGQRNQIVASVPWQCSEREVGIFVEKHRPWLEAQLVVTPKTRSLHDWLEGNPRLSGSGDVFSVRIEPSERTRPDYVFEGGGAEIILRLPAGAEDAETILLHLVRRFAKDALHCRVAFQAKRLGLSFSALSVRDQSTRWGSCSSVGGISLNWRLVLVAPELQDYVILHELAHLTELNHSHRFWALLEQYDPARKVNEKALDALTPEIMRVGRPRKMSCWL